MPHTPRGTEGTATAQARAGEEQRAQAGSDSGRSVAGPCSLPCTFPLACPQLDKLRMVIEGMLASSSTLLTMSIAPQKTPITLTPGQIDPAATCPACSLDLSHQVSTLVQRYEQLQNMVNSLAASRPSKKAKLQSQVTPAGLPPAAATPGLLGRRTEPGVAKRGPRHWFFRVGPFTDLTRVPGPSTGSQRVALGMGDHGLGKHSWLRVEQSPSHASGMLAQL